MSKLATICHALRSHSVWIDYRQINLNYSILSTAWRELSYPQLQPQKSPTLKKGG